MSDTEKDIFALNAHGHFPTRTRQDCEMEIGWTLDNEAIITPMNFMNHAQFV